MMSKKKGFFSGLLGEKKSGGCCNMEIIEETESCSCGCADGSCNTSEENKTFIEGAMSIKILGSGCKNCVTLTENTKLALAEMGLQANIEKVTDLSAITGYGVMSTPALVINEKVVSSGKVLKPKEIVKILEKVRGKANE
jgi:small redox-active disulfide protein 2